MWNRGDNFLWCLGPRVHSVTPPVVTVMSSTTVCRGVGTLALLSPAVGWGAHEQKTDLSVMSSTKTCNQLQLDGYARSPSSTSSVENSSYRSTKRTTPLAIAPDNRLFTGCAALLPRIPLGISYTTSDLIRCDSQSRTRTSLSSNHP